MPDLRLVVPRAVALELARVGRDLLGQVFGPRRRIRVVPAPLLVPAGELVPRGAIEALRSLDRLSAPGVDALAGAHAHRVEAGLALVHREPGLAGIYVDAIDAAAPDLHDPARRLDADVGAPPVDVEPSRPEAEDHAVLALAGHVVELAAAVDAQQRAVGELEFGPAALVRPDAVARQEGQVGQRFLGAGLGGALDGNARLDQPDPRVPVRLLRPCRRGQGEGYHREQPASRHVHHPAPLGESAVVKRC